MLDNWTKAQRDPIGSHYFGSRIKVQHTFALLDYNPRIHQRKREQCIVGRCSDGYRASETCPEHPADKRRKTLRVGFMVLTLTRRQQRRFTQWRVEETKEARQFACSSFGFDLSGLERVSESRLTQGDSMQIIHR